MTRHSEEEIAAEIERFMRSQFLIPDDDEFFTRDVNVWEEGYVDSMGVIEVVAHLEETFAITIPEAVLHEPAFTCISGMAGILAKLVDG